MITFFFNCLTINDDFSLRYKGNTLVDVFIGFMSQKIFNPMSLHVET